MAILAARTLGEMGGTQAWIDAGYPAEPLES